MGTRGRPKSTGFLVDWRNADGRRIRTRFQHEQEAIHFKREMTRQVTMEKMARRFGKVIRINASNQRPVIDRLLAQCTRITIEVATGKKPSSAIQYEVRRASV